MDNQKTFLLGFCTVEIHQTNTSVKYSTSAVSQLSQSLSSNLAVLPRLRSITTFYAATSYVKTFKIAY